MKKQLRKAMICTVAMMLVAVLTLTGVTYAWFSESNSAQVTDFSLQVEASTGGVYISKDPYTGFKNTLTFTDIPTSNFNPVSTGGVLDSNNELEFFKGTIASPTATTLDTIEKVPAEGYYLARTIYFENSMGTSDVTVSLDGTKITAGVDKNELVGPVLAARIAIVTQGVVSADEIRDTANRNYEVDEDNPATVQILDYAPTTHTDTGLDEYKNSLDPSATGSTPFKYYGVKAIGTNVNRFNEGTPSESLTLLTPDNTGILKTSDDKVQFTIPAGHNLKTTVYIWLEGQDSDCQNDISGIQYNVSLKFTLVE